MKKYKIFVINPGSTSTKIAYFEDYNQIQIQEVTHSSEELSKFKSNLEQLDFRKNALLETLTNWNMKLEDFDAFIGRGGPLKPLKSGVYRINQAYLDDIRNGRCVDHASILGGLLAHSLASMVNKPAFIADPVSVDEFDELARISGWPDIQRPTYSHALNIKAVVREYANEIHQNPNELNLIVAHLGGGISIAAHKQGRLVDVETSSDTGPFSPERTGALPLSVMLKYIEKTNKPISEWRKTFIGKGGLVAHLGTADVREIEQRIKNGDKKAELVLHAMAYQIAKFIGSMATVLEGKVDAIILTGGIAYNKRVVDWITNRIKFIAPVVVKPGQNEMKALAEHALNALINPSVVLEY